MIYGMVVPLLRDADGPDRSQVLKFWNCDHGGSRILASCEFPSRVWGGAQAANNFGAF